MVAYMDNNLKRFRSSLVVAGFFFLVNPYISLFDILPDFIGYILIFFGISELAKLDDRLALASQKLIYLAFLSLARLAAFAFSAGSDSSLKMTLNFAFGVAEIILALLFLTDFFGGIEYLLQRYDGYDALSKLGNIRFLSTIFFITKAVLGFLPDTVAILDVDASIDISASSVLTDIAGYKNYAVLLFFIITLIIGIWWFTELYRYFRTIKGDAKFFAEISRIYETEILPNKSLNVITSLRVSFIFIAVGFVFFFDFLINKVSIFPDQIATMLIWAGIAMLGKYKKTRLALPAVAALLFQTGYAVCVKIFAYTDITDLSKYPVKNAIIIGAVSATYAVVSFWFVYKVFACFEEISISFGCVPPSKQLLQILSLYALYLLLTVVGISLSTAYSLLLTPRAIVDILFIGLAIRRYSIAYDEYAVKLK